MAEILPQRLKDAIRFLLQIPGGAASAPVRLEDGGGNQLALAVGQSGAKVYGDLEVTGSLVGQLQLSDDAPQPLGSASGGASLSGSRSDHAHAHGNQGGGALHAIASIEVAGFMSSAMAQKLEGIAAGADVTGPANVAAAGAVMDGDFSTNGLMERTGSGAYAVRAIGVGALTSVPTRADADTRYEAAITPGSAAQYLRGDKTLGTLNQSAVAGLTTASSPTFAGLTVSGAATFLTINKVTFTQPTTSATLTIPDGVTLTGPSASGTVMTLGNAETITGAKTFGSAGAVGRLKIAGSTSGSTTLDASAAASGTLTLPAATDTLVGKATTDTFTNKAFDTAGTGNSLSINGVPVTANAGTGAVVRATSPSIASPTFTGVSSFSGAARGAQVALTDAATIAFDMALGNDGAVTLGGNRTLGAPTNVPSGGQGGSLFFTQDAVGSRTLSYNSVWKFAGGIVPSLSTTPGAVDRLDFTVKDATHLHAALSKDVK